MGEVHENAQGEGGEQGDPLMPLLFSSGQHPALAAANASLQDGERLFAYLDDIYVICSHVESWKCTVLLWAHARIKIHHGKIQLWNRGGSERPPGLQSSPLLRLEHDAVVWKSDPEMPLSQNGLRVLGAPIGHPLYIVDHELLFQRIPAVEDLLAAWLLLLLFCGATRANFWLRVIQPDLSLPFAQRHNDRVWGCLASLLHVPTQLPHARTTALMPLSKGEVGFGHIVRARHAAHFPSWADRLPTVRQRHPDVGDTIITVLECDPVLCFRAVRDCEGHLRAAEFEPRLWEDITEGARPGDSAEDEPPVAEEELAEGGSLPS